MKRSGFWYLSIFLSRYREPIRYVESGKPILRLTFGYFSTVESGGREMVINFSVSFHVELVEFYPTRKAVGPVS